MRVRFSTSIAVLLLLALLAGCGGGSGDESTGTATSASAGSTTGLGEEGGLSSSEGEGSESSESPAASSKSWSGSKQAFVKKADAICHKEGKRILAGTLKALKPEGIDGAKAPEMERAVETALAPGLEAEIQQIRALGLPAGEEEEVEVFFTALETQIDRARAEPTTFLREGDPLAEAEKAGEAYGFTSCGGIA